MRSLACAHLSAAPRAASARRPNGVRSAAPAAMRCPPLDAVARVARARMRAPARARASAGGEQQPEPVKPPANMGSAERRRIDGAEWLEAEAYGEVSTYCSAAPLASCAPDTPIKDILPHFEEFTGLPVLDPATSKPVGVVSEKDVMSYLQQFGDDTSHLSTPVKHVMSTPAVSIRQNARVAYAAGLMLQHRVHRLPVVDSEGRCVAMITRTDVFRPLIPEALADPLYLQKVEAMVASAAAAGTSASDRLAETFRKLHEEHTAQQPEAPTGVEEPPFGP